MLLFHVSTGLFNSIIQFFIVTTAYIQVRDTVMAKDTSEIIHRTMTKSTSENNTQVNCTLNKTQTDLCTRNNTH